MTPTTATPLPATPAFAELLTENRWLRVLARSLVRDAHDADDLAQDACVAALDRAPAVAGNVRAWLRTVMQNLVRQRVRADARRERREAAVHTARPEAAADAGDLVARAAVQRAVVDAVLALAPPFRDTVLLRFFEDQPPRAIAARMRVPVATVHSRLTRALVQLRQKLDRACGGRSAWRRACVPLPPPVAAVATPFVLLTMPTKVVTLGVAAALAVGSALWLGLRSDSPRGPAAPPAAATPLAGPPGPAASSAPSDAAAERVAAATPAAAAEPPPSGPAPRTVAGRVVDADGTPVRGAPLRIGETAARSDDVGAFRAAVAARESLLAKLDAPEWCTILAGVVDENEEPPPVLVVGAPAISLRGTVRSSSGDAIAGAVVQVVWPADLRSRLRDVDDRASEEHVGDRTRADGAFRLAAGAVRGAELVAIAEGFMPSRRPLPDRDDPALALVLTPVAATPGSVQGQVVDARGVAVPGARVGLGTHVVRADERGNFAIQDDGRAKTLAAIAAGHRRGAIERPQAGFSGFVVLPLGAVPMQIHGRVVDEAGRGVAGVLVWATDPTRLCEARDAVLVEGIASGNPTEDELRDRFERGEFAGRQPQDVLRSTPTAFWPWVRTGTDGAFVLGGLEDRAYSLRTMAQDTLLSAELAGVAAGSRDARLVLDASALFDEVRGVVVTRTGTPVANARIVVQIDTQSVAGRTQHGQAIASVRTGADGTFTLPKVPKERAYFRIDGDDILPSEPGRGLPGGILALAGGKPNDLRLEVRSRLHVQVELLDPTRADRIGVLDADGRSVHLTVFHGRGRRDTDRLELAAGRSPVFVVPDHVTTLVLFAGDEEVAREPLQLRPGSVNTLRF